MSVRYKRRRVRTKRGNFRNRRVGTLTRVLYNQKYAISVFALSGLYCSMKLAKRDFAKIEELFL